MSVQCYRHSSGEILNRTGKDSPCGNLNSTNPIVPCCANGDTCLSDGICSYQKSLVGGSGYYVAGCTASSGLCPGYPDRCTSQFLPDVTWNSTSGLWQCCGVDTNSNPACDDPTNEQFVAPSPIALQTIFSLSRDGFTATSTVLMSTSTSLLAASPTTPASVASSSTSAALPEATPTTSTSQNSLSNRTKAGIGVGAALSLLSILALVVYLVIRKRRRRLCSEKHLESSVESDSSVALHELQDKSRAIQEMGNKDGPAVEIAYRQSKLRARARGSTLRSYGYGTPDAQGLDSGQS